MEVENKLKEIFINKIGIPAADLHMEVNLKTELGMDSTEMVSVRTNMEKVFGINVPEMDFNQLMTLKDMVNYVQGKIE